MSACVCGSKEKFRASAGGPAMSEESGVECREDWERVHRVRFGIIWRLQNQLPNYVNIYTTHYMNWSTEN